LLTELERSKAQLKMDQVAAPYYIEYRVSDVEEFLAEAAFGALRENQKVHVRVMRVWCASAITNKTAITARDGADDDSAARQ